MSREQFLDYYEREGLPLSETAKANHWKTWQAAWDALLSARGPVTMLTMDNVEIMPSADESYSKGWKDCMEIAKK